MNKKAIYLNDWLEYHSYTRQEETDAYYIELANRIYGIFEKYSIGNHIPEEVKKQLACRFAAYLEDLVSESNIWNSFINKNKELYGKYLPFYSLTTEYFPGEPNREDIQFLLWNYLQIYVKTSFVDPNDDELYQFAEDVYKVLEEEYEVAPANEKLPEQYNENTLFTISYLYAPGNESYIRKTTQAVKDFAKGQSQAQKISLLGKRLSETVEITPCIPLALYADEWDDIISGNNEPELREEPIENAKETIERDYQAFRKANGDYPLAYFKSREEANNFFIEQLNWKKSELPDLGKDCEDVVLFANPAKGLLLATNINQCIKDERNPLYNEKEARQYGASLFMSQGVCPIDLLKYLETHVMLPDAMIECEKGEAYSKALLHDNWDFLARWFLREYYRA